MFESDIQHRQSLGSFFGGTLRLNVGYERVRIGAAETKWKPNGNIAPSTASAIIVRC
jgi:hypothetical protein